jgi:hypothetical protein
MSPSRPFILRPVATSLFMVAIMLGGLVGFHFLPLSALPEVDFPTIQVQTIYPGASPEVMSQTVTAPLERQLGQGRYLYWILAGADASPEALQWLHDRRVFCSGREQLGHLADLLKPAPPRMAELSMLPKARIVGLQDEERRPAPPPVAAAHKEKSRVVTIPAHSESEHEAVDAAEAFAREAGFEAPDVGRIKTAVLEGVLNAIEHSSDPEKIVRIELMLTTQALEILIDNEGPTFDPLADVPDDSPQLSLAL